MLATKTKTDVEILTEARKLIDTPDKWCQNQFTAGQRICLVEAVLRPQGQHWYRDNRTIPPAIIQAAQEVIAERGLINVMLVRLDVGMICTVNNDTDHATVLATLDRAIELASVLPEPA